MRLRNSVVCLFYNYFIRKFVFYNVLLFQISRMAKYYNTEHTHPFSYEQVKINEHLKEKCITYSIPKYLNRNLN